MDPDPDPDTINPDPHHWFKSYPNTLHLSRQKLNFHCLLVEEYNKDKKKFMKNAEEFTKKNCEKRPAD